MLETVLLTALHCISSVKDVVFNARYCYFPVMSIK